MLGSSLSKWLCETDSYFPLVSLISLGILARSDCPCLRGPLSMQLPHPGSCLQMLWCSGVLIKQQSPVNDCLHSQFIWGVIHVKSWTTLGAGCWHMSFPCQGDCSDHWAIGRCPNLLFFFFSFFSGLIQLWLFFCTRDKWNSCIQ